MTPLERTLFQVGHCFVVSLSCTVSYCSSLSCHVWMNEGAKILIIFCAQFGNPLHHLFTYHSIWIWINLRFGAQPLAVSQLGKMLSLVTVSIHTIQFLWDSDWQTTSLSPTAQNSNSALLCTTASPRMFSEWKLWIYFFLYGIGDVQPHWLSWFSPKSNLRQISFSGGGRAWNKPLTP